MKAFSLATATHLPVTGDLHPLRREATRWLTSANAMTLLIGLVIFGAWYVYSHRTKEEVIPRGVNIVQFRELGVPPSIKEATAPQMAIADAAPPSIGVPEPVPDEEAETSTIATQSQMSDFLAPITADDLGGSGDSLVIDPGMGGDEPEMGEFVAFDELPVLLSIQPAVYPVLAREAGIDGTVIVQVLVGRDGKVKKAVAIQGPEVLMSSAVAAAKTALFKPALQGTSPVEVWVQIPVAFTLSG